MTFKHKRAVSGIPMGLTLGVLIFLMITLTIVTVISALIYQETMRLDQGIYGIVLALLMGSFCGSITATAIARQKDLLVCLACGVIQWLALLMIKLTFFDGGFANVLLTMLLVLAGSTAAAFVKLRKKGSGYAFKRRRVHAR